MAANTTPIFSRVGRINWTNGITAANTAKDGTGTVDTVFTADAVEGSYIERLIVRPRGTNVVSVLRVFVNNGLTNATAANNCLIAELTLPATTNSEIAAISGLVVPLNMSLPAGYKINVTIGTAVAGGYAVAGIGGDY